MLTVTLILLPLILSFVAFAWRSPAVRGVALAGSLIELVISVVALLKFEKTSEIQFAFNIPWISSLGVNFYVGVDGINIWLVLLTTLLVPFIILSSFGNQYEKPWTFYGLILVMQSALVGVFTSFDGFLFYVFWEMALIPIYFICLIWGGENRASITVKFFIYTLAGSLLMLAALIYVYAQTDGTGSFAISALYEAGQRLPLAEQSLVFWGLFLAFAVKMPVFPFHTWQPDTYTVAPTQGTMLLSAVMLKMGLFGVIRWLLPVVPAGSAEWATTAISLSVAGIIYASCIAIVQRDYKRLIAYSSIAHVGLISGGIFSATLIGLQGAIIQMISHGILVFGLFFCVDIIGRRMQTTTLSSLGGIRNAAPVFATLLVIFILGSVALPLTSGFVGEFMLIRSLFGFKWYFGAVAALTIVLGAVYMLKSFQAAMSGELNETTRDFTDLHGFEKLALIPMALLVLLIGIYPSVILEISEASVIDLLREISNSTGTALNH